MVKNWSPPMKILVLLEFCPGTTARKRTAYNREMLEAGFLRLPGVSTAWVADQKFTEIALAEDVVARASASTGAMVHRAYVVEYGQYSVYPKVRQPLLPQSR